jgi:peptide deformylase
LSVWEAASLQIIQYPHPTLRRVSKPLTRVDDELRRIIRAMFDLMYQAKGIGLAANQVDLPYRMFILNLEGDPAKPELERVFLNPVLSHPKGSSESEEGCLSLPGLYADVKRPERITITAYDLSGQPVEETVDGLFARAAQHETDHLDGTLFIDRLSPTGKAALRESLEDFEIEFSDRRQRGEIPDDERIAARWAELEALRT